MGACWAMADVRTSLGNVVAHCLNAANLLELRDTALLVTRQAQCQNPSAAGLELKSVQLGQRKGPVHAVGQRDRFGWDVSVGGLSRCTRPVIRVASTPQRVKAKANCPTRPAG